MKRALSDSDPATCEAAHKRRRRSSPATCPAPPSAKWADVMGWLRAVPPGANADEAGPIPQDGEDSKIAPHTYIMSTMDYRRPDARREKKMHTRKRSVSPTKKPTEYRSIFLSEAGVFIDCGFAPPPAAPNLESLPISPELQSLVDAIAEAYCARCRDSATMGEGEGHWRAHASDTVMGGLRRYKDFAKILRVNGSDKPWRTELKPVRATTVIQRTIMPPPFAISPMAVEPKSPPAPLNRPNSFSSSTGVILNPPFDRQPAQFEPLDTDTLSYTSGHTSHSDPDSLSTPKPDISVGLEHRSFSPSQQSTLNYLETDPHAQTIGLHFPFLIFEAKGNAGLFGAQNQAAVGAACMLRILDLVHCRDLVVWSVTTEGPIHELWVHHRDTEGKYQSVHVGVWRMTNPEGAKAFVGTMARLMLWGSTVYTQKILQALDAVQYL